MNTAAATAQDTGAEVLRAEVIKVLKNIYDPEIPVNIYDLGLIYDVVVRGRADVMVTMTLSAPGCPVAQTFPGMVEATVAGVDGVQSAHVELTWEPQWTRDMMSEVARIQLGMI